MSTFFQDFRYTLRMLWKTPGFTAVVLLTLALGIGANTAIFSVINAVLLRPLPYPESDRLVLLNERGTQIEGMSISWPNYEDWRARNRVFEHIGIFNRGNYNLTDGGEPEFIQAGQVTADLFTLLRAGARLGRVLSAEEDRPGAPPVVVLSHGLWQRRFGGDPNIVGRTITLNGLGYSVIGVMPAEFRFPSRVEMWVSAGRLSDSTSWRQRGNHPGLYAVARLRAGVSLDQARADMDGIATDLEKLYPKTNEGNRVRIVPLIENYIRDIRPMLWVLFGAVGFVLLIACANVGNLLLARATTRSREMAVRAALGAGRWRIIRQLLTESVLLGLIGGALGLLVAKWGVTLILYISPDAIPRANELGIDGRVLAFTMLISMLTGIVFGLAPAWQASRVSMHDTLKEATRGTTGRRNWLRGSLVVTEVAAALVLLVGAGLLIRSFYRLQHVDPGFSYDRLLSVNIALPEKKYSDPQRADFFSRLLQNLNAVPGVESAAIASGLPLGNNGWQTSFLVEGRPVPPPSQTPSMEMCLVSPDYFKTMGITLKAGRYFTDQDNRDHLKGRDLSTWTEDERQVAGLNVVVIDEEFARRYWPNEEAVGKHIRLGEDAKSPVLTVVGVVGRIKVDGLREDSGLVQAYFPFGQVQFARMTLIVKSGIDSTALTAMIRREVRSLDPNQPIYSIRTMDQIRDESIASDKLSLLLLGLFAGTALVLAMVGMYGVMSYSVTQKTQEIGIRMALGAQSGTVLKLVIGQGMRLAVVGLTIGLVSACLLTRLMGSLLFNVSTTDPLTFVSIATLLTVVAFLACWIPARRAAKVDPMIALRCE